MAVQDRNRGTTTPEASALGGEHKPGGVLRDVVDDHPLYREAWLEVVAPDLDRVDHRHGVLHFGVMRIGVAVEHPAARVPRHVAEGDACDAEYEAWVEKVRASDTDPRGEPDAFGAGSRAWLP
jgi:hypothetical protein